MPARSYDEYRAAWAEALGTAPPSAKQMNRQLHGERIVRGTHRRRLHAMSWNDLPDGAFVLRETGAPALVLGGTLVEWTHLAVAVDHARRGPAAFHLQIERAAGA